MPFKTDLNVTPYFDDYSPSDNFQQILARPGFAVQARELTQLQSILRNHSEKIGDFVFQEGSVVIPGSLTIENKIDFIKIDNTYGGKTIDVTQYKDTTITGTTSGVSAVVIHVEASTSTAQPTLYVRYIRSGADKSTDVTFSPAIFADGETFSSSAGVTHETTAYSVDDVSAKVYDTTPTGFGMAAEMSTGVYYLRGGFVEVDEEILIISKYISNSTINVRIGFAITEAIVTPEGDSSLLDNATGSSNFAAKGAHRLKVTATLSKLNVGSADDSKFIELLEIRNGKPTSVVNRTQLGTLLETLARRTYDESGDYTIRPFMFEAKESITLNENVGVYDFGTITDNGNFASTSLLSLKISPGKAYIRGYEIEKTTSTFVDIPKARDFNTINAGIITYDVGNYLNITNVYGTPDVSFISGEATPYKQISIFDTQTSTRGSASGTRIGVARARTMEYSSGTAGATSAVYKLYLFDFRPFTFLTLNGTPSPTLKANHSNGGVQVKGVTSGATGWVFADGTSTTQVILTNVSGRFTTGEKITASDSDKTDQIVEKPTTLLAEDLTNSETAVDVDNGSIFTAGDIILVESEQMYISSISSNTLTVTRGYNSTSAATHDNNTLINFFPVFVTITTIVTKNVSEAKQVYMTDADSGQNFSADIDLTATLTLSGTYRTETSGTNATSSLNEALTDSETAVDVDSGAEFAEGQVILVESEQMYISSISSNTLTVTRGYNSTSAATHDNGTQVKILDHLIGVSGYNTGEVKVGDIITIPTGTAGSTQDREVMYVASTYISFTATPTTDAITTANVIRNRAKLYDTEKNIGLFKLNKRTIKTLLTTTNSGASDTSYYLRRQFIVTVIDGTIILAAGSNETFVSHSEADYTASILTAAGSSSSQGDIVSLSSGFSGGGTNNIIVVNTAVFGTGGAKVKIIATIFKTSAAAKTKTVKLMKQCKVVSGTTDAYGTRPTDKTISLGRADVFNIAAVLDSEDTGTDAAAPTLTVGSITGTFIKGEKIIGSVSNSIGRIIDTSSPISYVRKRGTLIKFVVADIIRGQSSGATATVSAMTAGSSNITNRFELDTGQRDNYYDISRIVRKPGAGLPLGKVLIIYDYMEHSVGDFFSVDSYTDVANQMTYEDIPPYTATKVDPDAPKPSGFYKLQDCFDIRPRAENITGANANIEIVDEITGNSFDFYNRQFDGIGSSLTDFIKPGSLIQSDFEYYLPYAGRLYLEKGGLIKFQQGISAESPQLPPINDDVMQLAEISIPSYTFKPQDVTISRTRNRRYTMKDIGKLDQRIQHVEYYTALNMLERDAESFEIQDANGLNRFKSGFVVDNFSGHRVGDTLHKDYKNSIDMQKKELRPIAIPKGIDLIESLSTDSARAAAGYQKTGDLITLSYSEVVFQKQPYASRVERVTPVLHSNWIGIIELNPAGDEWFETEVAPDLIINVEGNFDTFTSKNQDAVGTVWNSWQTNWSGVVSSDTTLSSSTSESANSTTITDRARTVTTTRADMFRTGIQTDIVAQIDLESQGTKVIQRAFIPFCRARNITFKGTNFYPNIRLYGFFDKQNVNAYITPTTGFTTDAADVSGVPAAETPLITSASGEIGGIFSIPDPRITSNLRFRTGEVEFRLTSSSTDIRSLDPQTAGNINYMAVGILETEQETITATKNAILVQTSVSGTTSVFSETTSLVTSTSTTMKPTVAVIEAIAAETVGTAITPAVQRPWVDDSDSEGDAPSTPQPTPAGKMVLDEDGTMKFVEDAVNDGDTGGDDDPLAQTFIVSPEKNFSNSGLNKSSGKFITSVDIFFSHKDSTLPFTLEIRNVVAGMPGPKILPFGRIVKTPAEISTSSDASTATTFTFSSPIYLQHETEYCIALITNTPEYKVWISRMGETEIGGSRTISKQPHIGVLFKGHNNRTWAPSLTEDLKFVLRVAKFDIVNNGVVTLNNGAVPLKTLNEHPLVFTSGNTDLFVNHKNHQMYSASNNVTISGVVSGAETTLAAELDSTSSSLTLTSGTDFDDTSGKYAYDSSSYWWIKIDDEIMKYKETASSGTAVSAITRAQDGTTAAAHTSDAKVELYMLHKVPLTEINKTHTALTNFNIDSYTVSLESSPSISGGTDTATNGGDVVKATENASFDTSMPVVSILEVPATSISATIRPMTSTSPSGSQSSFTTTSSIDAISINLNDNKDYDVPYMIASTINESNENGGNKSLILTCTLSSNNSDVSPIIDLGRMSFIAIGNKLNSIDSSSDIYPTVDYIPSTDPDGDNNAAIYLTKKVTLENSASALKIFFAAHRHSSSKIKVYYKILRTDDASEFDDLGYVAFNTDGSTDTTTISSTTKNSFQQYVYTAGVTDDGVGTPLDDFISFQIKIVMQGTNTAEPPRIKELRCIALAM